MSKTPTAKENNQNNQNDYYTIDLIQIMKTLWKNVWVIIVAGILGAAICFSISAFIMTPTYSSSVMLYVNNSSISLGNTSLNLSDLTAAQSLVKTYMEILKTRTTLEKIIEKTGVDYDYKELAKMIDAASANNTEIMRVTVTSADPYEAARIANSIAEVLPQRITEIIDGASMEVVDSAVPNLDKVSPSIAKYTAIGLILGVVASCGVLVVISILDDTIHDEDYLIQTYDLPILAKIPDLTSVDDNKYAYYRYGHSSKAHTSQPTKEDQAK